MTTKNETAQQTAQPEAPICAICGKPITSGCTIDHVIPQAIYKWNESYLSRSEFAALRRRITSVRNTVKTHRRCNERKEESIIRISTLHVSRRKRAKLRETYDAVEPYIEKFLENKKQIAEQQQDRCFICRIPLKDGGVLRRIDDTQPRTWDNACLICHRCNCRVKSKDVKTYRAHRGSRRKRHAPTKVHPAETTPQGQTPPTAQKCKNTQEETP